MELDLHVMHISPHSIISLLPTLSFDLGGLHNGMNWVCAVINNITSVTSGLANSETESYILTALSWLEILKAVRMTAFNVSSDDKAVSLTILSAIDGWYTKMVVQWKWHALPDYNWMQ